MKTPLITYYFLTIWEWLILNNLTACCIYNLFDVTQTIHLLNNEIEQSAIKVNTNNLVQELAELCNTYDCHKIHFYGPSDIFTPILKNLQEVAKTQYKIRISVEVN